MNLLRSIVFSIVFYIGSLFAVLSAFPVSLAGSAALRRHAIGWSLFHRWCARYLLGIRIRIEGSWPPGPILYAVKHQAMFETLELLAMLDGPVPVMKRELADIPLWGPVAQRYGVIPVDRSGSASALRQMLRRAREVVAQGLPIVIFPEGTRVAPGTRLPLQPGFAGLYQTLRLPVIPVALDSGVVWPRGFVKRAGVITFRFGELIPPGLPRPEIEARVFAAINALEDAPQVDPEVVPQVAG